MIERGKHRDEWQRLCRTRLQDAEVLVKSGRFDAAYYLMGYAVECALKARVVRLLEGYFPPRQSLYTHDLERLLDAAGLKEIFKKKTEEDRVFRNQWETVKDWREESRYDTYDQKAANDMLTAVRGVVKCIQEYW